MYTFKVGDLITGRPGAPYTITDKDSVCEILFTREGSSEDLLVRLVSHKECKEDLGKVYCVRSCYFTIYKETNNFRRVTYWKILQDTI